MRWLAFRRALAVRRYLIEEHGFRRERVESRAWLEEIATDTTVSRGVDARLVTPSRSSE